LRKSCRESGSKFKNWVKKHRKTISIIIGGIVLILVISLGIYVVFFSAPATIEAVATVNASQEVIKNLPAVPSAAYNLPARIVENGIQSFDLSYFLLAMERFNSSAGLSLPSLPTPNFSSSSASRQSEAILLKVDKVDLISEPIKEQIKTVSEIIRFNPHQAREVYNCNLTINQQKFSKLEISQYYKNKPGREKINDNLIIKIIESLNGKELKPDSKKRPSN
jgi:hypothetical protein